MIRRSRAALLAAGMCALVLVAVWFAVFHSATGRSLDARTLDGFTGLYRPSVERVATVVAHLADTLPFALAGLVMIAVALVRRRPHLAIATVTILLGANVTTQLLKAGLAAPRHVARFEHQIDAASWPSGHATAAMSLALCAVLVASVRWRPLVAALGGAYAIAIGYSILVLNWHFPSDVLGGYLVAALWTLMTIAVLARARERWPGAPPARTTGLRVRDALAPSAGAAALCAAAAVGLALARSDGALEYARAHTAFALTAPALAALALALAAGLAVALRR